MLVLVCSTAFAQGSPDAPVSTSRQETAPSAPEGFQEYSPATSEFRVLMPTPVDVKPIDRGGFQFKSYSARKNGILYAINGGIWLSERGLAREAFLASLEGSMKSRSSDISTRRTAASGTGWDGTKILVFRNGRPTATVMAAFSTSHTPRVVYSLNVTAPTESAEAKTFLDNFSIDNSKLSANYHAPTFEQGLKIMGASAPVLIGIALTLLFCLCSIVAIVVIVVLAQRKKKKPD